VYKLYFNSPLPRTQSTLLQLP